MTAIILIDSTTTKTTTTTAISATSLLLLIMHVIFVRHQTLGDLLFQVEICLSVCLCVCVLTCDKDDYVYTVSQKSM